MNKQGRAEHEAVVCCQKCGAHDLAVVHEYPETRRYTRTLPCDCPHAEGGVAAWETVVEKRVVHEWGWLDEDPQVYPEDAEDLYKEEEITESEVHCDKCVEEAQDRDWEYDNEESEADRDAEKWKLRCEKCGHEVDFVWRGGRICPLIAAS